MNLAGSVAAAIVLALAAGETAAQSPMTLKEAISAQPVASALDAFSRQTGLQVIYMSRIAEGLMCAAIPAGLRSDVALHRLLDGTGLAFEFLNERTVTIMSSREEPATATFSTSAMTSTNTSDRVRMANAGASAISGSAHAGSDTATLEEIVVSATKRQELARDIPQSITAIGSEHLRRAGIRGFQDYAASVPGLSAVDRGPGRLKIVLRGISTGPTPIDDAQTRETTGYYVDETPVAIAAFNPDLYLIDVARIEVLRGPQPTLYGAGSMSGTLRVITADPELDTFSGNVTAESGYTRHGGMNHAFTGVANVPLVDGKSALRLAAYDDFNDGFIDDLRLGEDNVNSVRRRGLRAINRTQLSDAVSMRISAWWQDMRIDEENVQLENGGAEFPSAVPEGLKINRYFSQDGNDRFLLGAVAFDVALGRGTLTSASSFTRREIDFESDYTRGVMRLLNVFNVAVIEDASDIRSWVQELRYVTDKSEPLRWTLGVSYSDERKNYQQDLPSPGIDALTGIDTGAFGEPENLFQGDTDVDVRQAAVFGEVEYEFNERLTASLGARAFEAETDTDIVFQGYFQGGRDQNRNRAREDGVNPKGSLLFKATENVSFYGSAARGFRLGGTNQAIPESVCTDDLAGLGRSEAPDTYDSDRLWNYEVGVKALSASHRFSANASLFRIDWDGIQLSTQMPCGFVFTANVGSARSQGVELDMQVMPVAGLTVGLTGSYVDAQLAKALPGVSYAEKGSRLPAVPRNNASLSVRYERSVFDSATAFFFGNVRHVGSSYVNFRERPQDFVDSYTLVDARVGLELPSVAITLSLYNVFDEQPIFYRENNRGELLTDVGRPRTVALQLGYRF